MKNEQFNEKTILNWFLQIALALEYIHTKKILHRDIKTSNIFVTGNGAIKLGDFGISKILEKTSDAANTVCGTPFYMRFAPASDNPLTFPKSRDLREQALYLQVRCLGAWLRLVRALHT